MKNKLCKFRKRVYSNGGNYFQIHSGFFFKELHSSFFNMYAYIQVIDFQMQNMVINISTPKSSSLKFK